MSTPAEQLEQRLKQEKITEVECVVSDLTGIARGEAVDAFAARLAGTAAAAGSRDAVVADALQRALEASAPGDRVLVFGSFHTVAQALETLRSGR